MPPSRPSRKSRPTTARRGLADLRLEALEVRDVPAAFTPGNLAVLSAGASASNTTASVAELTPAAQATPVQTITIPATGANTLRISGSATSTGYVSHTNDNSLLTFTGVNTADTTANINTLNPRVVGTLDPSATFAQPTSYTGTSGNQTRGATSLNNTTWFIADQGGLYTNSSTTASPAGNFRGIKPFGGTVYASQASGTVTTIQVVTLSAATGGTATGLPGLTNNASMQDFYLIRSGDNGSVYDVLYVISATSNTAGTVTKYSLLDTNTNGTLGDAGDLWTANGSSTTTFGGFGIAAQDNGNGALLYVTTGQGALTANSVVKLADTTGYNAALTITTANNVTVYTAPAGTILKGIDFVPQAAGGGDTTPPTVSSIVRAAPNPTNATSVTYTVTFSETVTGVDAADFALTTTGVTAASITGVTGSGTTYTVTVNTGSGSGTIRLDVADDDTVVDGAGNKLGGTGAGNGNFTTGEVYTIDKTAPAVSSIVRVGASPTNAASVQYTVTFSESVTGVGTADFALTTAGVTGAGVSSVTGSGTTYTVTVNTGSGSGTIRLDVADDDSIVDAVGNALGGTGTGNGNFTTGEVYTLDRTAPTASTINRAGSNPTNAASVQFTVTFSESVTGVDAADFALATSGVTGAGITGVTGSGTTYTVTVNTGTGSGTVGLNLVDDDTILDAVGNPLGGTGAGNGNLTGEVYTVDKAAPTVSSINRVGSSPTNAASVQFTVTFSESVTGVDAADFALATSGVTGASIGTVTGSGTTYTVTVNTGTGSGTVGLNLVDDDTIADAAGNKLGGTGAGNGNLTGQVYAVDKTAPAVSSVVRVGASPTNAASVQYTVTFSESVTGVDAADFTLTTTGVSGASVTGVTGSGTTYTVTMNTGSGSGTIRLDVADNDSVVDAATNPLGGTGAGNGNFTTGEVYTIDKTAPAVSSIVRVGASPTNAASVQYTVTFSESVTGVDAADFTLTTTGVTGSSIGTVTGSGTTYTVTVNTGSGSGTIRLDVADNDSVVDGVTNPLGGTGAGNGNFTTGEVYAIDKAAPTVSSVVRANPSPTNAASVQYTVTFGESVTGVDTSDFTLTTSGVAGAGVSNVTGSGSTYTVTVNTGSGSGTIRLDVADNDSVVDAAGNALGGTGAGNGNFTTGEVYTFDRTAPTVSSINRAGSNPTNAASVQFTVTFSESVTGVDAADFALATTGVTGASIGTVTGSGTTYTVTVNTGTGSGTVGLNLVDNDTIVDAVGNPLGGTGAGNGNLTGQVYTIDKTAPTAVTINRAGPSPTNAASVAFTVTFSESVTGVDAADFALATTGVTGASIGTVSGSGTTYTVTVNTGTGSGSIGLNLVDDDTITDAVGNQLGGAGAGNGNVTGQVYTVDKTVPTVSSVVRANPTPTNAASVQYTVTFSESVTGVDAADFALTTTGVTGASIGTVTGSGTTYTVTVNTGSGSGTTRLDVADNDSIVDAATNPLGGTGAGNGNFTAGEVYAIDKLAPAVTVAVAGGQASPTAAQPIRFAVTFTEPVSGFASGDVTLTGTAGNLAGATKAVTNPSGDNQTFFVDVSGLTTDGTVTLTVPAAAAADAAGNDNTASTGTATVVYDAVAPSVLSITRGTPAGPATNATSVGFTVTFSESVVGVDATDFALATAGVTGASIGTVSGSGTTYTVTVNTGSGDGSVGLNLVDDDSIVDAAGTPLGSTGAGNGNFTGEVYSIDKTAPTAAFTPVATPRNTPVGSVTLTFDGGVTGVTLGDFTLTRNGTPVSLAGASVTGGPTVYTITGLSGATTADGAYVLTFTAAGSGVADAAGNATTADATLAFTVDATRPTATITPATTGPTNAAQVTFTVAFGEPVTGVDTDPAGGFDNFSLSTTGSVTGAAITSIAATGTPGEYVVTADTGSGRGTIQLVLGANTAITDAAGNTVSNLPATSAAVTVDDVAPTVSIDDGDADDLVPAGAVVNYAVDVLDPSGVTGTITAADVVNAGTATVNVGTVTSAAISGGRRFTIPVTATTGGTIVLRVTATATVADQAGNPAPLPATDDTTVTADASAPGATVAPAAGQAGSTNTQPVRFTVTFTEAVVGFVDADVTVGGTAGNAAGATRTVTNPGGDNRTFIVAVGGLTSDGTVTVSVAAGVANDTAGNASTASNTASVTLDTTGPAASAPDLAPASDTGASTSDDVTADNTPTFTGTAEAGATVELFVGAVSQGTVTATGGTYSFTASALADGTYTVTSRATDATGNVTNSGPLTVTIDTAPATVAVTRTPGQPATVTAAAPGGTVSITVTFTESVAGLTAGDLTVGGTAGGSVANVSGAGTTYTVTVGGFARPGTVTLAVRGGVGTDQAGNPTAASVGGESVTVEFTTSTALVVSAPTLTPAGGSVTATAAVQAPANPSAVLTGSVVFTLTGPNGTTTQTASLTGGSATAQFDNLPSGTYTVSAQYAANAGFQASAATGGFTVSTLPQPPAPSKPPTGQNTTGVYAASGLGTTVTLYNANGTVLRTLTPFTAQEAPGGVRAAVADVNGDGVPDVAAVTGPFLTSLVSPTPAPTLLRVIDGRTGATLYTRTPFAGFDGGAFVAAGDVNGDGKADVVVTPDQGGSSRVTIFSGPDGAVLANFFGIDDPNFRGGARASLGDVNGDGVADLVVSAGFLGGPRVAGYDGKSLRPGATPVKLFNDFFLFEPQLRNGAYVTVGDVNGDGFGDVIGGGGPGGAPRVLAVSGKDLVQSNSLVRLASFFAGDSELRGGVRVTAKDIDGDGRTDLVTGSGDLDVLFVYVDTDLQSPNPTPSRQTRTGSESGGVSVG